MEDPSETTQECQTVETSIVQLDESTCHVLPCSIDFQGMAPTHLYFQPRKLENGISSAMFRGRGLLAKEEEEKQDNYNKCRPTALALIAIDNNNTKINNNNDDDTNSIRRQVHVKAEMSKYVEWRHEHLPETVQFEEDYNRFYNAQEWSEVAEALHTSIPVDIDIQ